MKDRAKTIRYVQPGSIAEEAGIEPGDVLISINGIKIEDVFDYRFLVADEKLLLEVAGNNGETCEIEIEKDTYDDIGLEFEDGMMDEARRCSNRCIFCFIDQLPKGMRKTLYFKDDDSRLSFLHGNYVTLTNMNSRHIQRIIRYRMSPVNVSVHTTNPQLRISMLGNRHAGDVLEKIGELANGGITVNSQIVLCRGINDGVELDKTIGDLTALYPGVKSISVVPVGITRYRQGLHALLPYDREAAQSVLAQVTGWQDRLQEKYGSRIVYAADEFYIMAGADIPNSAAYEDFPQIENGVGMVALFRDEFEGYLKGLPEGLCCAPENRIVSVATGVSVFPCIQSLSHMLERKIEGLRVQVFAIKNCFFGENVTVTGLLTGKDIVSQLAGKELGEELLLSESILKSGTDLLLDDYTMEMLEQELKTPVVAVADCGSDFAEKVAGEWVRRRF